jgi:hypothetical protein
MELLHFLPRGRWMHCCNSALLHRKSNNMLVANPSCAPCKGQAGVVPAGLIMQFQCSGNKRPVAPCTPLRSANQSSAECCLQFSTYRRLSTISWAVWVNSSPCHRLASNHAAHGGSVGVVELQKECCESRDGTEALKNMGTNTQGAQGGSTLAPSGHRGQGVSNLRLVTQYSALPAWHPDPTPHTNVGTKPIGRFPLYDVWRNSVHAQEVCPRLLCHC